MMVEVRALPDRPDEPSGPEVLARIAAVIVTYHPEPARLSALLDVIGSQVESVIIVDNGSPGMADWLGESAGARGCGLELLERNTGVAAAHNVGIAKARLARADAVLLLDQDSLPAANMVAELRRAFVALTTAGEVVGAVGPRQIDERTGHHAPFVRFGFVRNDHLTCDKPHSTTIRCDHLITSGTLVPMTVLDAVGGMDEALFVDNVDTEWCFRVMSKGYGLFGVCTAAMTHTVGDEIASIRTPFVRDVVVHRPVRLYYIMRNHLLLYGRRDTPARWVLQDVPRLIFKSVVFATAIQPRLANLSMIIKGIQDGIRGKTGSYDLR